MADLDKLNVKITADSTKAQRGVDKLESRFTRLKKSVGGIGSRIKNNFAGIAAGVGTSIFAAKKLIDVFGGFEQSIANVSAVSGDAREELAALAREMGSTTVFSAKEAADAMYFLSSAGLAVEDQAKVLPNVLNLASAAQIELAEASDLTTSTIKAFGLEMGDSALVVDTLTRTIQKSNTDMTQLGEAMKFVGPVARSVGADLKDTSAIIGALGDIGIKGSMAGTQLRQALARLAKPTAAAEKALSKYNLSVDTVQSLLPTPIELLKRLGEAGLTTADGLEILGVRQAGLVSLIQNGTPALESLRDNLDEVGGNAETMADKQIDTLQGSIKLLQSAFQELILSAGDGGLSKVFRFLANSAKGLVEILSSFPGWLKAIGIGIGILIPLVLALNAAFGPIGLVLAGIAAGVLLLGNAVAAASTEVRVLNSELQNLRGTEETLNQIRKDNAVKLRDIFKKTKKSYEDQAKSVKELQVENSKLTDKITKQREAAEKISSELERRKALDEELSDRAQVEQGIYERVLANNKILTKVQYNQLKPIERQIDLLLEKQRAGQDVTEELEKEKQKHAELYDQFLAENNLKSESLDVLLAQREVSLKELALTEERQRALQIVLQYRKQIRDEAQSFVDADEKAQLSAFQKKMRQLNMILNRTREVLGTEHELTRRLVEIKKRLYQEEFAERDKLFREATARGVELEKQRTDYSAEQLKKRLKDFEAAQAKKMQIAEKVSAFLIQGINAVTDLFSIGLDRRLDKTNEFQEKLDVMAAAETERERQKNMMKLQSEINYLSQSNTAQAQAAMQDKQLELEKLELEKKAAEEEKKLAVEASKVQRKQAIAQKISSIAGIVANTALGIMKAVASPLGWLTGGQPWASIIAGIGAAQVAAVAAKPLPKVISAATGADFMTNGPQMMLVGDNPGGREHVQVTPVSSSTNNYDNSDRSSRFNIGNISLPSVTDADTFAKGLDNIKKTRGRI